MAKKKSTTEEEVIQDKNNITFEVMFEIVVSNFGHVQHNQIEELFKLLNSKK
jgi:hypothetical protein